MPQQSYYQLLGVAPTASQEQIKAAYRRQALKYHPDKNPDDQQAASRFRRCSEAYAVLSDQQRRALYDAQLQGGAGPGQVARELVDEVLGRRAGRKRGGQDIRVDLKLSFRDAARGGQHRVRFSATEPCSSCAGRGAAPGGTRVCPECEGKGDIKQRGLFALPRPCPRCGGQGFVVRRQCRSCRGVGTVEVARTCDVTIPAGVGDGDVKYIEGQGERGVNGGRDGDLQIVVRVEPDPLFVQEGDDVVLELPVRYALLALGGVASVPTLDGEVRMRVPPGTQSGRVFRLRGQGLRRRDRRGDQLVRLMAETPLELTDEQRTALRAFDEACGPGSHPRAEAALRSGEQDDRE